MSAPAIPDNAELIGVDWGSSRLRIHLIDHAGTALETITLDPGVLKTERNAQRQILVDALHPWVSKRPNIPIFAAGMIGSRSGLVETNPLPTPVDVAALTAAMLTLRLDDRITVQVFPGLVDKSGEFDDLIRGEEAQVFGWLDDVGESGPALLVLPGTHSKWIRLVGNTVSTFHTFPTGELFEMLLAMPSLSQAIAANGRIPNPAERDSSFREGATLGSKAQGILHDIFTIRTRLLATTGSRPLVLDEYLSGMLIGYEIAEALSRGLLREVEHAVLISEGDLKRRYRIALEINAVAIVEGGESNFCHGVVAVYRRFSRP
ncbi:MAG: 2-dehydro-3-deoxygalactonokinase [Terrimesophilobacter sp.]